MEIIVKNYEHGSSQLPRVWDPKYVAARRRAEAKAESDPAKREELLQSADEWSRSKKVWHKTDRNGKPVFTSKKDVLEFQARTGGQFRFDK